MSFSLEVGVGGAATSVCEWLHEDMPTGGPGCPRGPEPLGPVTFQTRTCPTFRSSYQDTSFHLG